MTDSQMDFPYLSENEILDHLFGDIVDSITATIMAEIREGIMMRYNKIPMQTSILQGGNYIQEVLESRNPHDFASPLCRYYKLYCIG